MKLPDDQGLDVSWDGHASVRVVDQGFTVAVDPFSQVSPDFEADIVLVTRPGEGHFDRDKLSDICGDRTCVVLPGDMEDMDVPCPDVEFIGEGQMVDIYGVEIEGIPVQNDRYEGKGLGYRFVMGSHSVYVAGDTGLMDEAGELEGRVDIAFLPVEGVYTMDRDEAVRMAVMIKPDVVVPYHYGEPFFEDLNLTSFKAALDDRSIDCRVLEPGSEV